MLTMLQPVSPTYVLSKWNEGYDHRLLLHLFVKSIKFCDDRNPGQLTAAGCSTDIQDALTAATSAQTQISAKDYVGALKSIQALGSALDRASADATEKVIPNFDGVQNAQVALEALVRGKDPKKTQLDNVTSDAAAIALALDSLKAGLNGLLQFISVIVRPMPSTRYGRCAKMRVTGMLARTFRL